MPSIISRLMELGIPAREAGYIDGLTKGVWPEITGLQLGSDVMVSYGGDENKQYRIVTTYNPVSATNVLRTYKCSGIGFYVFVRSDIRNAAGGFDTTFTLFVEESRLCPSDAPFDDGLKALVNKDILYGAKMPLNKALEIPEEEAIRLLYPIEMTFHQNGIVNVTCPDVKTFCHIMVIGRDQMDCIQRALEDHLTMALQRGKALLPEIGGDLYVPINEGLSKRLLDAVKNA